MSFIKISIQSQINAFKISSEKNIKRNRKGLLRCLMKFGMMTNIKSLKKNKQLLQKTEVWKRC